VDITLPSQYNSTLFENDLLQMLISIVCETIRDTGTSAPWHESSRGGTFSFLREREPEERQTNLQAPLSPRRSLTAARARANSPQFPRDGCLKPRPVRVHFHNYQPPTSTSPYRSATAHAHALYISLTNSTMADVATAPNANQQVPLDSIPISPAGDNSSSESKGPSDNSASSEGEVRTVFHDAENFNVKHPLMNAWTLWFTKPPSGKVRCPRSHV
jgi:hypothetical protein